MENVWETLSEPIPCDQSISLLTLMVVRHQLVNNFVSILSGARNMTLLIIFVMHLPLPMIVLGWWVIFFFFFFGGGNLY